MKNWHDGHCSTGKILFRQIWDDGRDSFFWQIWDDGQDFLANLAGRARFFFGKFGTTGKILFRKIWRDGKNSLTKQFGMTGKILFALRADHIDVSTFTFKIFRDKIFKFRFQNFCS